MTITSTGDLAQSFQLRKQQTFLKSQLERFSTEATTRQTTTLSKDVRGDFRPIASIETRLSEADAYMFKIEETGRYAEAMQLSLGLIEDEALRIGPQIALLGSGVTNYGARSVGEETEAAFSAAVGAINTRFAGRSLFSGVATDVSPISDAATMLTEIRSAVAAETTAAGVQSVVDAWFGAGGAFETVHYAGAASPLAGHRLSSSETVSFSSRAVDDEFRDILSGLALGALLQDGPLSGDPDESLALATAAGERILSAAGGITALRGEVGAKEARIEFARTSLTSERNALDLARTSILEVDPFEAASQLQDVQTQLEILYSVTARTSRLSLADYL